MNLTVQTPDEWLSALEKPALEAFEQFSMSPEDWLVVCAGFEDRALGVLENAVSARTPFNILLILYEPFVEENKADKIRNICQNAGVEIEEATYNRKEPSGFGLTFIEKLSPCKGRILVDVSAMSRLLIVQILAALRTRPDGFTNCFVCYTEAKIYPPSQDEAEQELLKCNDDPTFSIFFLSSGVFEVTVIPELSSYAPAGTQTRLIAFPSLDAHQLNALRNEIQPSRFSFIEGVPPYPKYQWRKDVISKLNCLDEIHGAEWWSTSTLDYRETLNKLLTLYSKHSIQERLLISPTGSKMQTVAVGIFRAFIEDVQIIYPTPLSFHRPDDYTHGVGPIHILPLGGFHIPYYD